MRRKTLKAVSGPVLDPQLNQLLVLFSLFKPAKCQRLRRLLTFSGAFELKFFFLFFFPPFLFSAPAVLSSPENLTPQCFASPSCPASQMLPVDVCPAALAVSRRDNFGQKTHPIKHW